MNPQDLVNRLTWLGHDSFWLDGPPIIYFDPWQLKGDLPPADLVLVSHEHYDHCSPDDVSKVRKADTVIVAPAAAAAQLPGARVVRPGDVLSLKGVEIEAVPAYNINKFRSPGRPFHPRESGHVGYVVTVQGVRVYFAGDTDHIPEMADIRCDVAVLPVSGTYVMTADEAAEAARTLNPQIVVPMHYGSGIGTSTDGSQFAEKCDKEVVILESD